jgi:Ca-activated chloride channel family protein
MRPEDVFNIFVFSGWNGQLWESPRLSSAENIAEAKKYLNDLHGAGGTEMLAGVSRALKANHDPKFLQMYVFCTDGYVGDEPRILSFIKQERGDARFFAFGIGNGVNRYLIDGIGECGGGKAAVIMPRDQGQAERTAAQFFECIDSPVLVDVGLDWNGLPVQDVYPEKPGDLFAGGTLNLVGRYTAAASGTFYVTGRVGGRSVRFPVKVTLPESGPEHAELAPVWARWRIQDLSGEMLTAEKSRADEIVKAITDLAVDFNLVSQYTAFVAVDESRIVGNGRPLKVLQPVELPEGVSYEGVFGEKGVGAISAISAWGLRLQNTAGGKVRVGAVDPDGTADRAGVRPGAELKAVNGTAVHDIVHLEGLLLQSPGSGVNVAFDPGGETSMPTP